MMASAKQLRALLADPSKIIVCPGVYDGLTARIALNAGFECLYMTGAGTTMSRLGMPDLGVATLNDMRENAGMIAGLNRKIPLIADADTGYGGALMVGRTTHQYIQAGVAAFHLEDQVVNKRCGHLRNKEIVDEEVYLSRIRAAVNARAEADADIVIIARTDALQSLGFDSAVSRLKAAIAIGADVAFLEGFTSKEEGRKVCQELAPTPVLLNMVAGGVTPAFTVQEAQDVGFRIIIFPGFALGPVFKSVVLAAKQLKETGSVEESDAKAEAESSPKALFMAVGLKEAMEFDVAAGGTMYANGV
ncbi:Uncharacterized protein BP5553_01534 [Venustampulla echinocandica]|uniref:Uncharacterized protein n=1 Tax=Venustampulla echinocandica TaxID=2656787 RepID=A0A370U1B6_9HELO|nr:Uncharacterized protein BP5553_01534 [Venustampulla echinocandica]RDL41555.1 Uncharacterized protein BP5553_01534 [Venustampulla echinocandica]